VSSYSKIIDTIWIRTFDALNGAVASWTNARFHIAIEERPGSRNKIFIDRGHFKMNCPIPWDNGRKIVTYDGRWDPTGSSPGWHKGSWFLLAGCSKWRLKSHISTNIVSHDVTRPLRVNGRLSKSVAGTGLSLTWLFSPAYSGSPLGWLRIWPLKSEIFWLRNITEFGPPFGIR
jgi:hypothetical protein